MQVQGEAVCPARTAAAASHAPPRANKLSTCAPLTSPLRPACVALLNSVRIARLSVRANSASRAAEPALHPCGGRLAAHSTSTRLHQAENVRKWPWRNSTRLCKWPLLGHCAFGAGRETLG